MSITLDLINGICFGVEYLPAAEDYEQTIIVDLFVIRLLIQWS